jgi:hypothetical protein
MYCPYLWPMSTGRNIRRLLTGSYWTEFYQAGRLLEMRSALILLLLVRPERGLRASALRHL